MPLLLLECQKCGPQRRIFDIIPANLTCKTCGGPVARRARGAEAQVMEIIDNGFQARAVVRPADAQRLFKEREIAHDLEYNPLIDEEDIEPIDSDGDLV